MNVPKKYWKEKVNRSSTKQSSIASQLFHWPLCSTSGNRTKKDTKFETLETVIKILLSQTGLRLNNLIVTVRRHWAQILS